MVWLSQRYFKAHFDERFGEMWHCWNTFFKFRRRKTNKEWCVCPISEALLWWPGFTKHNAGITSITKLVTQLALLTLALPIQRWAFTSKMAREPITWNTAKLRSNEMIKYPQGSNTGSYWIGRKKYSVLLSQCRLRIKIELSHTTRTEEATEMIRIL